VAGFYIDGGATIGFYINSHGHAFKLAIKDASMTPPFGVNDKGGLAGFCTDDAGNVDGMLARP